MFSDYVKRVSLMTTVPASEWSKQFVESMLAQMDASFRRHGKVADSYPHKIDAIESLKTRLAMYEEDGDPERLVDVANLAMIEFMHPARDAGSYVPRHAGRHK